MEDDSVPTILVRFELRNLAELIEMATTGSSIFVVVITGGSDAVSSLLGALVPAASQHCGAGA